MRLSDFITSEDRPKKGVVPPGQTGDSGAAPPVSQSGGDQQHDDHPSARNADTKEKDAPEKSSFRLSEVSSPPPRIRPERDAGRAGRDPSNKVMLSAFSTDGNGKKQENTVLPAGKLPSSDRQKSGFPGYADEQPGPKAKPAVPRPKAEESRKSSFSLSKFLRSDDFAKNDLSTRCDDGEDPVADVPAKEAIDGESAKSEENDDPKPVSEQPKAADNEGEVLTDDHPVPADDKDEEGFGISGYDDEPVGIYEAAKQLGIDVPESRTKLIRNARSCLMLVFKKMLEVYSEKNMVWPMVKSIATDIEGIVQQDGNILTIIQRHRVQEEKLLWHSIYTAILAMDLAVHTKCRIEASIQDIGGAALLHDIGLLAISGSLNAVNDENHPRFREHVARGVDFAREAGVPESVITMIRQHHERIDGLGFPEGIRGADLLNCSQILGVSNIFEHAVIDVSAENKQEPGGQNGLSSVFAEYRKAFDNQLLKEMIALIGYYPVGSMVELSNRSVCEVVRQNEGTPLRPVVKIIIDANGRHPDSTKIVDLKQVGILSVIRAIGSTGLEKRR